MADTIQTLGNSTNDLVIERVQRELQFQAKLLPFVTDYSAFAVKGAKQIEVPRLTSFTVVDRALGAAGDATALTDATDIIALDKNAYVAWLIDHSSEIQSTIGYQVEAAMRAATAHGRYLDEQIISVIDAEAFYSVNGGTPADVDLASIVDMRQQLLEENARIEDMVLVISPDQEAVMLQIADFVRADYYGSSNIPGGVIGRVYGVPVVVHNGFSTAQQAYMFSKEGVGFALQLAPNMSSQLENSYGSNSYRYALDQQFGVAALQLAVGGAAAGRSPLITKLNGALV